MDGRPEWRQAQAHTGLLSLSRNQSWSWNDLKGKYRVLAIVPGVWVGGGTASRSPGPSFSHSDRLGLGLQGDRAGTSLQPKVQMHLSQDVPSHLRMSELYNCTLSPPPFGRTRQRQQFLVPELKYTRKWTSFLVVVL